MVDDELSPASPNYLCDAGTDVALALQDVESGHLLVVTNLGDSGTIWGFVKERELMTLETLAWDIHRG